MMATLFATMENVEAVHASSAMEALEIFKRGGVDVILTDVRMERIDGITFLRKLKKIDEDAVVIVMTAYDRKEDILTALKLGAFDFFIKPFSVNEFKDSLARAFAERGRRDAAAGGENAEALASLRAQLEKKEHALRERESALEKARGGETDNREDRGKDLAAREKAVREAEAALADAQAEMERKLLAIDDFSSFDVGVEPPTEAADPRATPATPAPVGDAAAKRKALEEREALLAEREAFLEQSENALFEKGQSLQELEAELEHMRDQLEERGARSGSTTPSKEALAEIEAAKADLLEKTREIERRERDVEEKIDKLSKREKQLARSEALVRAREKYLEASESILFEKED